MHNDLVLSMKELYSLFDEDCKVDDNTYILHKDKLSKIPSHHLNYLYMEYCLKIELIDEYYYIQLPFKEDKK